jgi:hypothetical protein
MNLLDAECQLAAQQHTLATALSLAHDAHLQAQACLCSADPTTKAHLLPLMLSTF